MNSIKTHCIQQNYEDDLKSESTIQIEFSESIVQRLETTNDNKKNSYPSFQRYYSRKRCSSRESQRTINKEDNINKKQRNHIDHLAFSENARKQQIISLSDSNESQCVRTNLQPKNELICKNSVSVQNDTENHLDWLKDFMRRSLDTIRDTVVQACLTAISAQSIIPLNSNITTHDINVNNHLTHRIQSEHSLKSRKTMNHWQNYQLKMPSVMRKKNHVLLYHHRLDNNEDDDDDDDNDINKKQRIHHRARRSPYPMYKNVLRTLVNDIQVPWSYEWPQYKPIIFTAQEIYINPGADPDLLKSSSSISLHFNTIDGAVDRRSVYQHYHIREQDGLPLNPIGRTGLQGRGILLRWGPNIYHYIMICRWKRDIYGNIFLHPSNGKKILEILLEIQTDGYATHDFILTGGLRMIGSRFPPQLQDRLKRFIIHTGIILNNRKKISSSLIELNHLFEQNPTPWKGAYFDDARNTDNAWIELSIEYLLDNDHQLTSCIPYLHNQQLECLEQPRFIWKDVKNTIDIGPRTHYRLIKNLAYKLDAYF
ncbi:unnamed protein product [Rotaria sordida]|uniref:Uncharacterized protein n=1 Tax=Rotaria sordida TaxID=392033 RepID=A0A819AHR7_9BILA|nr:unnamed protein product [Rotaria sordida]CAF1113033.1 unnamed protein product [Rotaria sordida]CAF1278855.1 unnamed protein product [Rotaria sordida]CAF1547087.1 unnamed protein product [Rotaria sordida]CAF3548987.1 unnamed protein product [Rotaria sordida]